jgi:hypothetical protein
MDLAERSDPGADRINRTAAQVRPAAFAAGLMRAAEHL